MSNLVPFKLREYIQSVSLSLPIGVKIEVAGGAALDIYRGVIPRDIDVFVTGCEILTEGKHFSWRKDDSNWFPESHMTFFGMDFKTIQSDQNYETKEGSVVSEVEIDGMNLQLITINEQMSLLDLLDTFDMDICRVYIDDINTLEWEPLLTSEARHALNSKEVQVGAKNHELFPHAHFKERQRVEKYKKKFPGFRFYKEL